MSDDYLQLSWLFSSEGSRTWLSGRRSIHGVVGPLSGPIAISHSTQHSTTGTAKHTHTHMHLSFEINLSWVCYHYNMLLLIFYMF